MKTSCRNMLKGTYRTEVACKTKDVGMNEKIAPKDHGMFEFGLLHQLIGLHFLVKCFQRLVVPCDIREE